MNKTNDYEIFNNCRDKENDDFGTFINYSLLSIPSGILLLSLISLFIWTFPKPLKYQ